MRTNHVFKFSPVKIAAGRFGTCLLLSVALLVCSTSVIFAKGNKSPEMAITRQDENGDGTVSRDEWRKSPAIFQQIDSNGDGQITLQEFRSKFSGESQPQEVAIDPSEGKEITAKIGKPAYGTWYGDDRYWQGPIIDAHSQVDDKTKLAEIVFLLDQAGVTQSFLSTRFTQPSSEVLALAAQFPDRIIPVAKTKSKAFMKGNSRFPEVFYREIESYDYTAMAEVIMWHAAKKAVGAGKAAIAPDDPRLEPLIVTARSKGWPFVAHIEFAAMGFVKSRYLKKFETFLSTNHDVPIGLIHMGQLRADDAAELLSQYPNLFFITSHSNPVTGKNSKLPWTKMFKGEELKQEWRELILKYPERFVLAFDNVFAFQWEGTFIPQVLVWRKALAGLPDPVAHSLAHRNAERLWKLAPASLP